MRIFLALILFSFILSIDASAQWYKLPAPTCAQMTCIQRVGNEIWAGSRGGLYISTTEGMTWQRSAQFRDCIGSIIAYNDTVVMTFTVVDGAEYNTFCISSFDNGVSWTTPVFLESPFNISAGVLIKSAKAIFFKGDDFYIYKSTDGGQTWAMATVSVAGDVYEIYSDGVMAVATVSLPGPPYEAYYYSLDGQSPWIYLDSTYYTNFILAGNNRIFLFPATMGIDSFVYTDNYGADWDTVITGATGYMYQAFNYNGALYLSGADSLISNDNGLTWTQSTLPDYRLLRPGVNTTSGYRVCLDYSGDILTYFPSTNTSVITNTGVVSDYFYSLYANNSVLFTSSYDIFYRSTDGGLSWNMVDSVAAPIDNMIFRGDTIYAVDQGQGLFARSYDNGVNWFTTPIPTYTAGSTPPGIAEINDTIFISGYISFFSTDAGVTWDTLPPLPQGVGGCTQNNDDHGTVSSYFNNLYSLTNGGHLFRFDPSAQSWDTLFCFWSPGAWNWNVLQQVENMLVITGRDELFMSADSGKTWVQSAYTGLPVSGGDIYIPKNIINIGNVWFCTLGSYGIHYSMDQGMSWSALSPNSEFISTQGLCHLNGILYSIAYHNGVWRRQDPFFTLTGNVYHDLNNNGVKDPGENGISNILVISTPGTFAATTTTNGDYTLINDIPGTVSAIPPSPYVIINPSSYPVSGAATNLDFGLFLPGNINDLVADMTNVNVFSPGFHTTLQLTVTNAGSSAPAPQAQLVLDSVLIFNGAVPPPDVVAGDTLTWNLSSIDFLEQELVHVDVTADIGTPIGHTVICRLDALPIAGDTTPINNTYFIDIPVVGSYDPNDKTCVQGEFFTPAQLAAEEELEYIIRFQNTGNFPTSFIVLTDTLSPVLDPATFRMVSSSHPCDWSLSGWGALRVEYNPIALPPSTVDEQASHGYFKYAIKCREAAQVGNAIDNTAAIFFDFNPPVITNTVTTLIADPVFVTVPEAAPAITSILPYPNPATESIRIRFPGGTPEGMVLVRIFDMMGTFMSGVTIDPDSGMLHVSRFASGMYFGVVTDKSGKRLGWFRFIKN